MAKANPKAWFTHPIAKITYRPVSKHDQQSRKWRPYFETWDEAHAVMLDNATMRLKQAQKELKSATSFHAKVTAMRAPAETPAKEVGDA